MRVAAEIEILVELKAVKSFVSLHFSEGVLFERALRYDLAVAVDLGDGITKSIKSISRNWLRVIPLILRRLSKSLLMIFKVFLAQKAL